MSTAFEPCLAGVPVVGGKIQSTKILRKHICLESINLVCLSLSLLITFILEWVTQLQHYLSTVVHILIDGQWSAIVL
jgi:hypothetical protein